MGRLRYCYAGLRRWCHCFDPDLDLTVIQRTLSNDPEIKNLLGLSTASPLEIAKHIIKRSQWDDLISNDKRITIYPRPSRSVRNEILTEQIIEVDCHVPTKQDYIAHRVQKRVKELLHNTVLEGRRFHFEMFLGELPTAPGFVCVGSRFRSYVTI